MISAKLIGLLWAFLATMGFGLLFKAPIRDLPYAALGGAISWAAYLLLYSLSASDSLSFFVASVIVGLYTELASVFLKRPATLFIISAIIPLVPGAGMYRTMFEAVMGDAEASAKIGFQTLSLAGAIAGGLAVASAISRILWHRKPFSYGKSSKTAKK